MLIGGRLRGSKGGGVEGNPEELLDHLDPEQRAVATNVHGPLCVLAGAGTGKTRAITYRIAYAVSSGAHDPRNILAVTFTSRAAGEMRSRLRDLGVGNVVAKTFHSAALSQLSYFWPHAIGGRVPEIKEHKGALISQAAAQLGMAVDRITVRDLSAEVEWSKVSLITPEDYPDRAQTEGRLDVAGYSPQEIGQLIRVYEEVKADRGVIDFEDVLLILIGIMRDRPDITQEIRRQYRHFVVDEYQDVSPMQHRLLQMWMGDRRDLCVVGDVSQTIYSFTGATSSYLANFDKEFPKAKKVVLKRDYRSTPQIVELANEIISADDSPGAVHLQSMLKSGRQISYDKYGDDADEAAQVAGKILTLRDQGVDLRDIAILYRTNAQSAEFENALGQAGISFAIRGSERFFNRREVKDAMVVMRAVARGSSSAELPELVEDALRGMGWRPSAPDNQGAAREKWESLNTLLSLAKDMWEKRRASITEYVAELEERAHLQNEPTLNAVTLSSLHAAKGLEWTAVFLVGMSEGLMPISLAKDAAGVAEERRLLYVGVTRAKEELYISYAAGNGGRGQRKLSRFLERHWPEEVSRSTRSRQRSKTQQSDFEREHPEDVELLEELKQWRKDYADSVQKPPFVILHDATLYEIAIRKPKDLSELGRVRGIGTRKLTTYGFDILGIVNGKVIGSGR